MMSDGRLMPDGQPEYAMGAIGEDGVLVGNEA